MRLRTLLFVIVVLFTFSACDSSSGPEDETDRAYLYIAKNAGSDTNTARGHLDLRFENADEEGIVDQIAGTWEINELNDTGEIGPQVGEGELQGVVREDGSVRINLNPTIADHNVILTGSFRNGDRSLLEGQWTFQTLSGSISGDFEASQVGPLE